MAKTLHFQCRGSLTLCDAKDYSMPGFPVLLPPGACSDSRPLSWWCHPVISSSVVPFSSCLQSFPASGSFLMSWLFSSYAPAILKYVTGKCPFPVLGSNFRYHTTLSCHASLASSNTWPESLPRLVFQNIDTFEEYSSGINILWNVFPFGFVWCVLMIRL